MKKLITHKSKRGLVNAYVSNPVFHNIVKAHESQNSDYTEMLEDAVIALNEETKNMTKLALRYAEKFGALNDA